MAPIRTTRGDSRTAKQIRLRVDESWGCIDVPSKKMQSSRYDLRPLQHRRRIRYESGRRPVLRHFRVEPVFDLHVLDAFDERHQTPGRTGFARGPKLGTL